MARGVRAALSLVLLFSTGSFQEHTRLNGSSCFVSASVFEKVRPADVCHVTLRRTEAASEHRARIAVEDSDIALNADRHREHEHFTQYDPAQHSSAQFKTEGHGKETEHVHGQRQRVDDVAPAGGGFLQTGPPPSTGMLGLELRGVPNGADSSLAAAMVSSAGRDADDDVRDEDLRGFVEGYRDIVAAHKSIGLLGASAMVYEWIPTPCCNGTENHLAVKVNHKGKSQDMFRELEVLQYLRSQGFDTPPVRITKLRKGSLLDLGGGEYGMVMQLARGVNPTPKLWKEMTWRQKVHHLKSFATTLGTLHARGCVHRDVKRGNLLCDQEGVVLIDFSSMTCAHAPGLEAFRTDTNISGTKGTRFCRAPEAADDTQDGGLLTAAADAFSMGLYCMDLLLGEYVEFRYIGRSGGTLEGERKAERDFLEYVCSLDWGAIADGVKKGCDDVDWECVDAVGRVCGGLLRLHKMDRRSCLWAAEELGKAVPWYLPLENYLDRDGRMCAT